MRTKFLCAAFCVLCSLAAGQWSEPALVVSDTWPPFLTGQRFTAGQGDTLWVLYVRGDRYQDTCEIRAQWSTGGAWSSPEVVVRNWLLSGLGVGVDPQNRIWLGWYNGDFPTGALPEDTWGIWTCVRDSGRWSEPELAIGSHTMEGIPTACSFGTDREGNWLMGIEEQTGSLTDMYLSAMYSRLEGDTWIWPRYLAQGQANPEKVDNHLPTLTPNPEYQFWATRDCYMVESLPPDWIVCTAWRNDTAWDEGMTAPAGQHEAVYDGAATLMVAHRSEWDVSVSFQTSHGISTHDLSDDIIPGPVAPHLCYDSMAVLWVGWTTADTTSVVCYTEHEWFTDPEPVTESTGILLDLTTDSEGRVYAMFGTGPQTWYTTYRLSRPGVEGRCKPRASSAKPGVTVVRGVLWMPRDMTKSSDDSDRVPRHVLLDISGRKVLDLLPGPNDVRHVAPGVCFVRSASGVEREASAVTKVVLTR